MGVEDFTTYSEVDSAGDIVRTAPRVTVTTMRRDAEAYIHKDFEAGYFGNFEFEFDIDITDVEAGDVDDRTMMTVISVGDAVGSGYDVRLGTFMHVYLVQSGALDDRYRFEIKSRTNGENDDYDTGSVLFYTTDGILYCAWERAGTTLTLKIYDSDADRAAEQNVLDTLSCTCNVVTYRYLLLVQSEERTSDPADHISGYVENLDLDPTAIVAPSVTTLSATLVEDTTANPRGEVTDAGGENPTRYIDYDPDPGTPLDPDFVKSGSNPIWSTSDYTWSSLTPNNPAILRSPTTGEPVLYEGKYWMAYDAINEGIGLATSTNLVDWTDDTGNPILEIGDAGAESWEKERIAPCDFLYMGDEVGHSYDFWLFYKGMNVAKDHVAVGVAKSNDMDTWTRDLANNPIATWVAGWISNCNGIEDFRVQKMSNGNWMALYEANQSPTAGAAIGAASTTQTLPHSGWSDEGQVCSGTFGADFIANPIVIRQEIDGSTYYMAFYEWDEVSTHVYGMYAEESDIFTLDGWTQMSNPVIAAESGWEDNCIIPNGLIHYNGEFYVYYTGNISTSKQIGLATASVTYADTKNCGVGGVGIYNSNLTELDPDTKYYYRARAVNSAGTDYGSQMDFTTTTGIEVPTVTTQDATGIGKGDPP